MQKGKKIIIISSLLEQGLFVGVSLFSRFLFVFLFAFAIFLLLIFSSLSLNKIVFISFHRLCTVCMCKVHTHTVAHTLNAVFSIKKRRRKKKIFYVSAGYVLHSFELIRIRKRVKRHIPAPRRVKKHRTIVFCFFFQLGIWVKYENVYLCSKLCLPAVFVVYLVLDFVISSGERKPRNALQTEHTKDIKKKQQRQQHRRWRKIMSNVYDV